MADGERIRTDGWVYADKNGQWYVADHEMRVRFAPGDLMFGDDIERYREALLLTAGPAPQIAVQVNLDPGMSAERIDHTLASMARRFYRLAPPEPAEEAFSETPLEVAARKFAEAAMAQERAQESEDVAAGEHDRLRDECNRLRAEMAVAAREYADDRPLP